MGRDSEHGRNGQKQAAPRTEDLRIGELHRLPVGLHTTRSALNPLVTGERRRSPGLGDWIFDNIISIQKVGKDSQ